MSVAMQSFQTNKAGTSGAEPLSSTSSATPVIVLQVPEVFPQEQGTVEELEESSNSDPEQGGKSLYISVILVSL